MLKLTSVVFFYVNSHILSSVGLETCHQMQYLCFWKGISIAVLWGIPETYIFFSLSL